LGIDNFIIEELSELSSGQAKTALAADEYINDDSDFVIYNIDTYIEPPELNPSIICGDGCIPAFRAQEDGWSYIDLNDNGNVSEVREKETFSNLASIGFYYFSSWLQYKALVEENEDEIIKEYGEVYVAPVFNYVINNGGKVTTHELDRDKCHIIGTPEELSRFESSSGI
jgi:dTDP-glucose pyrophosphorylase